MPAKPWRIVLLKSPVAANVSWRESPIAATADPGAGLGTVMPEASAKATALTVTVRLVPPVEGDADMESVS